MRQQLYALLIAAGGFTAIAAEAQELGSIAAPIASAETTAGQSGADARLHLMAAAEALQRAGLAEQEAQVRALAESLQAGGGEDTLSVQIAVVEIDLRRLRAMGIDVPLQQWGNGMPQADAMALIDGLRQQDAARILARPTLITVNGRLAEFTAGGEVAVTTGAKADSRERRVFIGTRCSVRPLLLDGDHVLVDLDLDVSSLGPTTGLVDRIAFATQLRAGLGETYVMGGMLQGDDRPRSTTFAVVKVDRHPAAPVHAALQPGRSPRRPR